MQSILPQELVELANVQQDTESMLLDLPNVVGVGIGSKVSDSKGDTGQPCITALVSAKLPRELLFKSDLVPHTVGKNKVVTDVMEVGDEIKVSVLSIDDQGRVDLAIVGVDSTPRPPSSDRPPPDRNSSRNRGRGGYRESRGNRYGRSENSRDSRTRRPPRIPKGRV